MCSLDIAYIQEKNVWRIDFPLSAYGVEVIFCSHDGFVYRLYTEDGELIWRFRAGNKKEADSLYD